MKSRKKPWLHRRNNSANKISRRRGGSLAFFILLRFLKELNNLTLEMNRQSLANADWFQARLPRLYDLYDRSIKSHPDNYFTYYSAATADDFFETCFKPLEEALEKLDSKAWEKLIGKALNYVTEKSPRRGYAQLFNHLNEARGYALLADRGYDEISFIDCENENRRSPDLFGKSQNSKAILEVKTINESEKDINLKLEDSLQSRSATRLSKEFENKLHATIEEAKEQLDAFAYPDSIDKRIIFLVVRFDLDNWVADHNFIVLRELVEAIQIPGLEVVHEVI
jgi:hypothetical protein